MTAPTGRPDRRRAEPLWDRVDRNRLKLMRFLVLFALATATWFGVVAFLVLGVIVLFTAEAGAFEVAEGALSIVFGAGAAAGFLRLWLAGLVLAALYEWWALSRSERWLLRHLRAELVPKGDLIESKMALKDMAIASGETVAPSFHLIENSTVNAFVFASGSRRPALGVTRGLVDKLTIAEQRAVFANLMARVASGDTAVATAITALATPLHAFRDWRLTSTDEQFAPDRHSRRRGWTSDGEVAADPDPFGGEGALALLFPVMAGAILAGEFIAAGHRRSQLHTAERADAEGMLLLKDPPAMLSALEKAVRYDNVVPHAGSAFAELFYCWTGDSTNDDEDPEWERVARLREVLGVEGVVTNEGARTDSRTAQVPSPVAPPAPRVDQEL